MSQENVEIVKQWYAAFAASGRVAGEFLAADHVWVFTAEGGWPDEAEYRGADEMDAFVATWTGPYEEWYQEAEDVLDVGDDRVVAVLLQRGRLRGSDAWLELRFGVVHTMRGGLLQRAEAYPTPEDALEAVGLRE